MTRSLITTRKTPGGNQWQESLRDALIAALGAGIVAGVGNNRDGDIVVNLMDGASGMDENTAIQIVLNHDMTARTAEQQAIQAIKDVALTAVGVPYSDLTLAQLKALLAVLIFESGGIGPGAVIRPLGQWVNRGE